MNPATDTALATWLKDRVGRWRHLDEALKHMHRGTGPDEVRRLLADFRAAARDLSLARVVLPQTRLTDQLEGLVLRAYDAIYQPPRMWGQRLALLVHEQVPEAMYALRARLAGTVLLFFGLALAGFWLVHTYPELAGLFASEKMIDDVQRGHLWTAHMLSIAPPSLVSLTILSNNIVVTLTAFMLGTFYGVGTLYIIGMNGLLLGAALAFTARYGLAGALITFMVAHGIVEISVICIAGACGISLGDALIHPGLKPRLQAFSDAARSSARVLIVALIFLAGAGVIEGYVSPRARLPFAVHLGVGLAYGFLFLLALTGRLFRRPSKSLEGADAHIVAEQRHIQLLR